MKSKILFFIFSLGVCATVSAQSPILFGVRGGTNFSGAKGDAFTNKLYVGFEVGAYAGINFMPQLGIQVEALYQQTRLSTKDYFVNNGTGIESGNKKLNYFSIPILARFNLSPEFSLIGGPQLNVLTDKDKYLLDNRNVAFKERSSTWIAGFEFITKSRPRVSIYGRVAWGTKIENIGDGTDAKIIRMQLGVVLPIIGNEENRRR